MRRILAAIAIAWLVVVPAPARAQSPESACTPHIPWGAPSVVGGVDGLVICRPDAYLLQHGAAVHGPARVAFRLTSAATFGCFQRTDHFHPDELLPRCPSKAAPLP